jgi:hypothetical protein
VNDLASLLKNCELSFYADDLKMYKCIRTVIDCNELQKNVDTLFEWCSKNYMILNVKKCAFITFSRKRGSTIQYDYVINSESLNKVNKIKDLGVIFDSKLNFKDHIDKICHGSSCMLGFIKRRVKELNSPYLTKSIYSALILPLLEYANVVWSPSFAIDSGKIESVQKQFLLFALRDLNFNRNNPDSFVLPPYESRLLLLNMTTLEKRRQL